MRSGVQSRGSKAACISLADESVVKLFKAALLFSLNKED